MRGIRGEKATSLGICFQPLRSNEICSYITVWLLQQKDVCFGAGGNSYGSFTLKQDGVLIAIRLVHSKGHVTCSKRVGAEKTGNYWGCGGNSLSTVVTDKRNGVIFPKILSSGGSYTIPNREASSEELIFYDPVRYRANYTDHLYIFSFVH